MARFKALAAWEREALQRVYDQASITSFKFTEDLLLRHVLDIGASGAGKTNQAKQIIGQALPPDVSCLIIDVKKEYRWLKGAIDRDVRILAVGDEPRVRFNPLAHPAEIPADLWDLTFIDVFTRAYGLSEPSRRILVDSLATLRKGSKLFPTLRELEKEVARFRPGSSREQNSQTSLESRLHIINKGPMGVSLNSDDPLDLQAFDRRVTIFEIGRLASLRDQRFLAEIVLMQLWEHDKSIATADEDKLKRMIVVEEGHRYLSEERPPMQEGERTLLELAIAEARRYGWGFLIVDQMPLLLSQYVWDNCGTLLVHRLANLKSYGKAKDALGGDPIPGVSEMEKFPFALRLPENLAFFKRYTSPGDPGPTVGSMIVPRMGKN